MSQSFIHILPPQVANQIAAGEVVERPASAVKELMENSVDAGAKRISVRIEQAGKKRIEVEDDGMGMSPADAELALQRHATSKIESSEDLHRIASHGFRGEALPSIASVSRFRMTTAVKGDSEAIEVRVDGGLNTQTRPAAKRKGTKIEILDLFLNTPARLQFMRTDKTEEAAIVEVFKGLALAHPNVAMSLQLDGRKRFDFMVQSEEARVLAIMPNDFADNFLAQSLEHEGMKVTGYLGLPTFHHRDSTRMLFLVNGRVIRDKQLIAALRAGYRDVMFHDRYPVAVIRLEIDPAAVDVNVHPAKREVRFKSPQAVFAAIVGCVRTGIERMGQTVASTTTGKALDAMQSSYRQTQPVAHSSMPRFVSESSANYRPRPSNIVPEDVQRLLFSTPSPLQQVGDSQYAAEEALDLGQPLAQIHQCYVLSQTADGIILVDQHAAHERMTFEKLKSQLSGGKVAAQMLLTPEALDLGSESMAWVLDNPDALQPFAVSLKVKDEQSVWIQSVPAMLSQESPAELVAELIESCMLLGIEAEGDKTGLGRILERWLGNRACKGSIKAGHTLRHEEQVNLLREMEQTPNIAQCNHGRPTYVGLSLYDLDKLFGRKE
ncbi:DNA mismatch repair endonuclease MutL [Ghiorsea bivora]|uniref:DNA mismatch repair endonuclease MutL n=1 Tax=Ghiorsea bivora TaxID=1485545 RepID=UPI000570A9EB|nr:DNA mismatch repair endonuclease MutL [Ghiorsea bivora]